MVRRIERIDGSSRRQPHLRDNIFEVDVANDGLGIPPAFRDREPGVHVQMGRDQRFFYRPGGVQHADRLGRQHDLADGPQGQRGAPRMIFSSRGPISRDVAEGHAGAVRAVRPLRTSCAGPAVVANAVRPISSGSSRHFRAATPPARRRKRTNASRETSGGRPIPCCVRQTPWGSIPQKRLSLPSEERRRTLRRRPRPPPPKSPANSAVAG